MNMDNSQLESPTFTKYKEGDIVLFKPRKRTAFGYALPGDYGWETKATILKVEKKGGYVLGYGSTGSGRFYWAKDYDLLPCG